MIKIHLIRHGKTEGNLYKRYIGITDESLCTEGIRKLKDKIYEPIDNVYSSPLLRCIETCNIIYPLHKEKIIIVNDLKECNFGDFENKNYLELQDNVDYQNWVNSNGLLPFPNGEDIKNFKLRCISAFDYIISDLISNNYLTAAIVCHGGTIMSILEKYSLPKKDYYSYMIDNGCGYNIIIDKVNWSKGNKYLNIISTL